jgi:uncharacterized protein (TIGR03067 family)
LRLANRWLVLLLAVSALGLAPLPKPKPDRVKEELKRLQGRWEHVSFHRDGERVEVKPGSAEVIRGGRLTVLSDGEVNARWAVVVDPSKRPKTMDLSAGKGRGILCVYRLEGDTLTVAYGDQGTVKERPADLAPRKGALVQVFKRKKP